MKFQFEKFGYVDKGTVELGDLTIICGPNNVGKTYVSYAIYNFIKDFQRLVDLSLSLISFEQIDTLKNEGLITIDLTNYQQKLTVYTQKISEEFNKKISNYFSTPSEFFEQSRIEFSFGSSPLKFTNSFKENLKFGEREALLIDKAVGSNDLSVALQLTGESKLPNRIIQQVLSQLISECIFSESLPKPFVVTSERTGIALFYKELDTSKNAIIEYLTDGEERHPIDLIDRLNSRYARPIQDNINVVRNHENISKQKSFIREDKLCNKAILDILQDLLGGTFKSADKQLFYQPKKKRNRSKVIIPVYIASSSIKSLFLIDLYINCLAEKNGLLIIDEPELNLHPDNQRKMASLLARLVNAGVKVLITTHSDYIIRELNNRIMLSNDVENKEEIMKKNAILTEDILLPEQVKAFVVKSNHSIQEIAVDRYGINFQIFDELIADSNKISDDIYYNIKD